MSRRIGDTFVEWARINLNYRVTGLLFFLDTLNEISELVNISSLQNEQCGVCCWFGAARIGSSELAEVAHSATRSYTANSCHNVDPAADVRAIIAQAAWRRCQRQRQRHGRRQICSESASVHGLSLQGCPATMHTAAKGDAAAFDCHQAARSRSARLPAADIHWRRLEPLRGVVRCGIAPRISWRALTIAPGVSAILAARHGWRLPARHLASGSSLHCVSRYAVDNWNGRAELSPGRRLGPDAVEFVIVCNMFKVWAFASRHCQQFELKPLKTVKMTKQHW
jgi:hypothetical protein